MLGHVVEWRVVLSLAILALLLVALECLIVLSVLFYGLNSDSLSKGGHSFLTGLSHIQLRSDGSCPAKYKIRSGDTIAGIARKFNVSIEELIVANSLQEGDFPWILEIPCLNALPTPTK